MARQHQVRSAATLLKFGFGYYPDFLTKFKGQFLDLPGVQGRLCVLVC